jgi:hypothetical protein
MSVVPFTVFYVDPGFFSRKRQRAKELTPAKGSGRSVPGSFPEPSKPTAVAALRFAATSGGRTYAQGASEKISPINETVWHHPPPQFPQILHEKRMSQETTPGKAMGTSWGLMLCFE